MKVELLVVDVIICTIMSNSQLQKIFRFVFSVLFLQSMLRFTCLLYFSVPALHNTDDRRSNIDNFS